MICIIEDRQVGDYDCGLWDEELTFQFAGLLDGWIAG